jgi:hypothetical protein
MRSTSKAVFIALMAAFTAGAQKPVGISRFIDPWIDGWALQTNIAGDNEMATAWAANSLLPLFTDPTGLPVLFPINDGNLGGCGGNVGIAQLSKLAGIGVTATAGNTLTTPVNCMSSYAGSTDPNGTWNDSLSWKGAVMAFRNNRLLAYFYRQANAGNAFTDSSLVLSLDAGQTWIDYGRYNGYTVTAASCTGTTVTLTATNALSAGQKIYVHDVGTVYDGKQTIATANGSQVTYTVSTCTGATGATGYFGILAANGSAPLGPLDAGYNMMWPASAGRQMVTPSPISYGQDGNYPTGIDSACDPTVWVCGTSTDAASSWKVYLWRVPLGQEMTKASYQWYTCPGYNALWAVPDTVCDGNNNANWTATMASAAPLLYTFPSAFWPAQMYHMKYLPSHGSYLTAHVARNPSVSRLSFDWAPHPWGPFYPVTSGECAERDANYPYGCVPFFALMDYGENVVSTTPPLTQIRISAKNDHDSGNGAGSPGFWTVEAAAGRVPFTGAARRADYMGISGQLGMGHRFVSGNEVGAISRRGSGINGTYSLDWWTDFWDHGGATASGATSRPWFRDVISGGAKYTSVIVGDGANWHNQFAGTQANLMLDGVHVGGGEYGPHLLSSFTDSVLTGNASWTIVVVFNPADTGSSTNRLVHLTHNNTGFTPWDLEVSVGAVSAGDLCVRWASDVGKICTAGSTIAPNTWYFLAISAAANGSGYPTITMSLGNAGAITEFGGTSMATAATGTSAANLTKTCSSCSLTPSIAASGTWWWGAAPGGTGGPYGAFAGIYGELGLYSGAVPGHVIREIYRTLRTDWARVGRGAL